MKTLLVLLTLVFCSFTAQQPAVDYLNVPGPLTFGGTAFHLAWSAHPSDNYYVQEYIPTGEKVDSFNQMLIVNIFKTDIQVKDAVQQKINELETRKKNDPVCQYEINQSPDGKEFIVDFLLGEQKNDLMTITEFNVYRYKHIALGKKKKAILVYAYSKRAYGEQITAFLKSLRDDRMTFLNNMITADVPSVTLHEK